MGEGGGLGEVGPGEEGGTEGGREGEEAAAITSTGSTTTAAAATASATAAAGDGVLSGLGPYISHEIEFHVIYKVSTQRTKNLAPLSLPLSLALPWPQGHHTQEVVAADKMSVYMTPLPASFMSALQAD